MAVQSETSSISYAGNNSTVTSYAVPFPFEQNTDLLAIAKDNTTGVETPVTLANHFGAGDPNGGTVTTATAVPTTSTLTIYRSVLATQTTTYVEGGDFPAESHERALDKLTYLAQQNQRAVNRSFRVTEGSANANEIVAIPNTIVGLDNNKQPKAMTLSEVKSFLALTGTTLDVAAGMKTFADSGERNLAVPDFIGQVGTQRDTGAAYIATGTTAGSWSALVTGVSLASLTEGFFTANATGRGKFANGFVNTDLVDDSTSTTTGITNSKLRHSNACSVIGRGAGSTGQVSDITATQSGQVLRRSGFTVSFGQLATDSIANGQIIAPKLDGAQTGNAPIFGVRAWVNFNGRNNTSNVEAVAAGDTTNRYIRGQGNVSQVQRTAAGEYVITFAAALPEQYCVLVTIVPAGTSTAYYHGFVKGSTSGPSNRTNSSVTVAVSRSDVTGYTAFDAAEVNVLCIG